jgi:hypothetical protein
MSQKLITQQYIYTKEICELYSMRNKKIAASNGKL